MESISACAAKEALLIIDYVDTGLFQKIPDELIYVLRIISKGCKEKVQYKEGISIMEQPISDEAKAILTLIYRDFLATREEKDQLKNIEYIGKNKLEWPEETRSTIDAIENSKNKNVSLNVVEKPKWYQKLFAKLKGLFE